MKVWADNISTLNVCLGGLLVSNGSGRSLEPDVAFSQLKDITVQLRNTGNTIFLIGNGASASMASHIAADLAKNARIKTKVFTDLSLITALANDISYEEVFADPLRREMIEGEMLVAISSSGQSPNILRASQEANQRGGFVVTLSAMKSANPLRTLGALNFYIPADTYGLAETGHAAILHFWVDQVVAIANT